MIASWKARKTVHRNNERKVTKEGKKNVKEEGKKKQGNQRKEGRTSTWKHTVGGEGGRALLFPRV